MLPDSTFYLQLLAELAAGWEGLPDKPGETPETTLRALWLCAGGQPISHELAQHAPLPVLDESKVQKLHELVLRRAAGEPLAYLTGRQSFMGLELRCSPAAMIPRQETELLVRAALELAAPTAKDEVRVADLCSGSGNVALALAAQQPNCRVWGVDNSAAAVTLACENAQHLGLQARVAFLTGDLFTPLDAPEFAGGFDMITCNPPYISSAQAQNLPPEILRHEPRTAFDGGPYGVALLARLVHQAPAYLRPDGWLVCEVGQGQGRQVAALVQKLRAYSCCKTYNDKLGQVRVIAARVQAPNPLLSRGSRGEIDD